MNKRDYDILKILLSRGYISQREIAESVSCSLGYVNHGIKRLKEEGYLDEFGHATERSQKLLKANKPRNAIILAAGFGMRMAPINTEVTKGLLEVNGESLIERLIKQLHEVGVNKICIVVGFLKESYEYLIDKYGVELIINTKYATTNNLFSVQCAIGHLYNTYIVPCDLWFPYNPFSSNELYSWYMVSDKLDENSEVFANRNGELVKKSKAKSGNAMIGVSYISNDVVEKLKNNIHSMCSKQSNYNCFWEDALYDGNRMITKANIISSANVFEINTYEQLRELDAQSKNLKTDALVTIMKCFDVSMDEIKNIAVLKKGMTNRSFSFDCNGRKYIMRIPGEGTSELINRQQEYAVYQALQGYEICDNVLYINATNGYKITDFWNGARVCDPLNYDDVVRCMKKLKDFHSLKLKVEHEFNLFDQINKYERLRDKKSIYRDYKTVKEKVFGLRKFIKAHRGQFVLTHIDAVPDNFLFVNNGVNSEIKLIDWEYAGMQDPHVDIAMFCIYAMYDDTKIDQTIDVYFENRCQMDTRLKIYCYIAVCGLLWSNWCEYKQSLGVDFGEYSLAQYRFAKVYSDKAIKLIEDIGE